jgi:ribonuclease P protein component
MDSSVTSTRQTFRKSERLCSRKILETLASKGRSIHVVPFRLVWLITPLPQNVPAQIAFAVPKRNIKSAVERNTIKRRMRESYRKNKSTLNSLISDTESRIALLLIFTGKQPITYNETEIKTKTILTQLAQDIKKYTR